MFIVYFLHRHICQTCYRSRKNIEIVWNTIMVKYWSVVIFAYFGPIKCRWAKHYWLEIWNDIGPISTTHRADIGPILHFFLWCTRKKLVKKYCVYSHDYLSFYAFYWCFTLPFISKFFEHENHLAFWYFFTNDSTFDWLNLTLLQKLYDYIYTSFTLEESSCRRKNHKYFLDNLWSFALRLLLSFVRGLF